MNSYHHGWMIYLIYSQTDEKHLSHLELVFGKFRGQHKIKNVKMLILQERNRKLRSLMSGQELSPMKQNIKAITDLTPATNITET